MLMNGNVILALTEKLRRLRRRKQEIQDEAKRRVAEIDAEIQNVQKAIDTAEDAMKDIICPVCKGTGNIRVCDAAGSMEERMCGFCHGTGIKITED